jgi:ribose/xylose/arabinose/galactoside ABC-type transport system permease subunit
MSNVVTTLFRRHLHNYSVLIVLIALCIFLSVQTDTFLTVSNLQNVLQQISVVGIITMGMALLLISGNFDLSVGGMVALVGVLVAQLTNSFGLPVALVAAPLIGIVFGAINAFIVTTMGVNSLVATLGSGMAFSGIAYLLSGSAPIVLTDGGLQDLMTVTFLGLPVPVYLLIAVIAVSAWFLHFTAGGRQLYAVGANESAARFAGVNITLIRTVPFVITGLYCGISALVLTGLLNSAQPGVGSTYPLQVIAAAVVGGISIAGGRGTILMAVIGVVLIGVVSNGFNLLGLDPNWQNVFTGVIVIVAVALDTFLRRRALRVASVKQKQRRDAAASARS